MEIGEQCNIPGKIEKYLIICDFTNFVKTNEDIPKKIQKTKNKIYVVSNIVLPLQNLGQEVQCP